MNLALFSCLNHRRRWLLSSVALLVPLLSWGQTTLAVQDFETTPGTPTAAVTLVGGAAYTSSADNGDSPAGAAFYSQGSRAYGVSNGTATVTSSADINASGYASASLSFRLASFSINSTTNGAEASDRVTLAISTDGGATYVNQLIVSGNSNARWSFASGTGTASRAYAATANTTVTAPASGGSRTNDGYATVSVTGIPSTTQLRFRITLLNNDASERWIVDDLQVVGATTSPSTPTLAAPATLNGFTTTAGTPSTAQTYTLTGTNTTAATTVTAPAGFAVSLEGTTYAASVSAPVAAVNSTGGQSVYVRLTGAAAGSFGGNVTNTSGAAAASVAVSGTTTAAPVLAVGTIGTTFNALAGTPSAAHTYALSGTSLTDDVMVTAPAGFEVSLSGTATDYGATKTVTQSGGTASATVYVRLTNTTAGTYSGNVRNASSGATTRNVAVSGTVVGKPTGTPTIAAGTLTFNSAALTLGAADGTNLLVVVRPAGTTATAPTDQATYTGSTAYAAGTALGAGFVVLATANTASVTVTGLSPGTAYAADVYTYNQGTGAGFESYGPGSGTASFSTPVQPLSAAGVLLFEDDFDYASNTALNTQGWAVQANTGVNVIRAATGNVTSSTYPQGAALSTGGTSSLVSLATSGEDLSKGGTLPTGATAIYGAAIIKVSAAQPGGDYFTALTPSSSSSYRSRVFIRSTGAGFAFGLTVGGENETYESTPTVFAFGTAYVLVVKAENSAATNNRDVASLYVLPVGTTSSQEPAAPLLSVAATGTTNNTSALSSFVLRQGSASAAPTLTLDGVRLATGWGAAIGRPVFTDASGVLAAGNYYSLRAAGVGTKATLSGPAFLEKQLNLDGGQVATTAASLLTLRARNIIGDGFDILVNPGGTSYVDGPVARESVTGASLLFPLGRSGNYRPLTLNISSFAAGTTTYTAVQTEGRPADQTLNAPLTRISRVRYFSITPSPVPAAGVFTGTVALSFGDDDAVTDPSQASFVIAKSDGAGWRSIGRGVNTASSLTSDTFQDFSDFSLASTAADGTINPLPVQLTSFAAARTTSGVQVAWATASELNSSYFEVERSLDGTTFGRVASVPAQGNTARAHSYTAPDRNAPATRLYYRLRQVDRDGTVAYSPTVSVAAGAGAAAEFALAPNPAHASLHFLTEQATAYTVRNPLGQAVRTGTTQAGTNTVAVNDLPAGVYFFELHSPQGRVVRRFVKE